MGFSNIYLTLRLRWQRSLKLYIFLSRAVLCRVSCQLYWINSFVVRLLLGKLFISTSVDARCSDGKKIADESRLATTGPGTGTGTGTGTGAWYSLVHRHHHLYIPYTT